MQKQYQLDSLHVDLVLCALHKMRPTMTFREELVADEILSILQVRPTTTIIPPDDEGDPYTMYNSCDI